MRQFSILVVFALAFGGAAVFYEQESRKVKGVLTQVTDLQARLGDMQAEINRLNAELEALKLAERRRPHLKAVAGAASVSQPAVSQIRTQPRPEQRPQRQAETAFSAGDVTSAGPVIRREDNSDDAEWARPTVDAEEYEVQSGEADRGSVTDPYQ